MRQTEFPYNEPLVALLENPFRRKAMTDSLQTCIGLIEGLTN